MALGLKLKKRKKRQTGVWKGQWDPIGNGEKDDYNQINEAELEAVLKGVNLALKRGLRELEVRTDSATVLSWVNFIVEESRRIRTKGSGEMIIKWRQGIQRQVIVEFGIKMKAVRKTRQMC